MKYLLILNFLLVLLFPPLLQAQSPDAPKAFVPTLNVGIKGGFSLAQVAFDPTIDQTLTKGFMGGVVFQYIDHAHVGVQAEINYVQKGWTEQLDSSTFRRSLNYLELPFMTHVVLGKKKSNFIINMGPSLSYLLSDKDSIKLVNEGDTLRYYQKRITNNIDFGLTLGIGYAKKTAIGTFQLDGRLTYNFTNIISQKQGIITSTNQNLIFSISYLIPFKRREE